MFSAYYRDFPEDPVVQGFRSTAARLRALCGGGRLLDVGIGTGLLLHLAREAGFAVQGCEISAAAAQKAREEFEVEVEVGDFLEMTFPEPVDALTMADVLEHTRDPALFLRHAAEVLRPGGALFVAVPNHRSTLFAVADVLARLPVVEKIARRLYVPNHYWYFTPATLERLVTSCGFEVKEIRQESPYLGRYAFSPIVKFGLAAILALGRWTGREARVEVYAVRAEPAR